MALTKLHDMHVRRKSRNVGLGLVLGLFVALILALTVVKVSTLDLTDETTVETSE